MANAMTKVSDDANTSSEFALKSVAIATKGLAAVRSTIDGMASIREQIQETSKRIKRLGESSQEIGDIIGLITEIADQTNILALNAAIQAASAGDAGRGFAVVADEVQRLAERSSNAAKQVEGLVRTIQADTNEAISSMEQSTSGVVNGAKLAENAGAALDEIEIASKDLAESISNISSSSRDQALVAKNITNTMLVIQEITVKTSEGTIETAESIGLLATLSEKLRDSVSGFKLPDQAQNDDFGNSTRDVEENVSDVKDNN
jgi:twitching motility protein PilJ